MSVRRTSGANPQSLGAAAEAKFWELTGVRGRIGENNWVIRAAIGEVLSHNKHLAPSFSPYGRPDRLGLGTAMTSPALPGDRLSVAAGVGPAGEQAGVGVAGDA